MKNYSKLKKFFQPPKYFKKVSDVFFVVLCFRHCEKEGGNAQIYGGGVLSQKTVVKLTLIPQVGYRN